MKTTKIYDNEKEVYSGNCYVNTVIFRGRIYDEFKKVGQDGIKFLLQLSNGKERVAALAKSRPNQSATDKSRSTRKGLNASESTQSLDKLISRNGSGSYQLESNLPLEISILALYPVPKYVSRKTKDLMLNSRLFPTKKPDADNIIKVILDALNGVAYRDDAQICRVYIEKMYAEIPETKVLIKNYGSVAQIIKRDIIERKGR